MELHLGIGDGKNAKAAETLHSFFLPMCCAPCMHVTPLPLPLPAGPLQDCCPARVGHVLRGGHQPSVHTVQEVRAEGHVCPPCTHVPPLAHHTEPLPCSRCPVGSFTSTDRVVTVPQARLLPCCAVRVCLVILRQGWRHGLLLGPHHRQSGYG